NTRYGTRRLRGATWCRSTVTVSVAISPASAWAMSGAWRRSTTANGRCQSRSTTCGPASLSTSLPSRGPIPGSEVTWANRGVRLCGRMVGTLLGRVTSPSPHLYATPPQPTGPGENVGDETDLETRRKRLLYRSVYRGNKENDILLGQFA